MKKTHRSPAAQAKLNPRKVEVKDLSLKARQLRVRGGGKSMGRIDRAFSPISLNFANTSLSPTQLTSLQ